MKSAVLQCCADGHRNPHWYQMTDTAIIPAVMASITYCDERVKALGCAGIVPCFCASKRFAAAADKLRDFATVELLCADLGITRKELN